MLRDESNLFSVVINSRNSSQSIGYSSRAKNTYTQNCMNTFISIYSHFQFLLHHFSLFFALKTASSFFLVAQPESVNVFPIIVVVIVMVLGVLIAVLIALIVMIMLKCRRRGVFSFLETNRWTGGDFDQIQLASLPHAD